MKKLILVAFAALLSVSLSAQIYVGGSFNFNSVNSSDKLLDTSTKSNALTFAPMAGYYLSEKFSAGARLTVMTAAPAANTSDFGFGLTPFARYELLAAGNFKLLAEGGINFLTYTSKAVTAGVGYQKDTQTSVGVYAEPVLTYALNDKITLEAVLNVARLGFTSTTDKGVYHVDNPAGDTTTDDRSRSSFNLGANANDIFGGGIGTIAIGFTYNF